MPTESQDHSPIERLGQAIRHVENLELRAKILDQRASNAERKQDEIDRRQREVVRRLEIKEAMLGIS